MEQHQGQQPQHLRLVGHQVGEQPAEPDRLGGQLAAFRVALVEDQVDDREHRRQAIGEPRVDGHGERNRGRSDLRLGPRDPTLHRLLGDQKRTCDLHRGEPAERPQRQRHLCLHGQRRVTAGEDQLQAFVGDRAVVEVERIHRRFRQIGLEQPRLAPQRLPASYPVDGAIASSRDQPGDRILRRPVTGPPLGRDRERLLGGLLGEVDVTEEADQGGEDAAPLAPEDLLDQ